LYPTYVAGTRAGVTAVAVDAKPFAALAKERVGDRNEIFPVVKLAAGDSKDHWASSTAAWGDGDAEDDDLVDAVGVDDDVSDAVGVRDTDGVGDGDAEVDAEPEGE
jgi:hypothetical protein